MEEKIRLNIDDEFVQICESIVQKKFSEENWAEMESGDMFQTPHFCGGFDATENAFCFSYYDDLGQEYWFQLDLNEVEKISQGSHIVIQAVLPYSAV